MYNVQQLLSNHLLYYIHANDDFFRTLQNLYPNQFTVVFFFFFFLKMIESLIGQHFISLKGTYIGVLIIGID